MQVWDAGPWVVSCELLEGSEVLMLLEGPGVDRDTHAKQLQNVPQKDGFPVQQAENKQNFITFLLVPMTQEACGVLSSKIKISPRGLVRWLCG